MKKNIQFKFLALFVALAYVLSACSGAPAGVGVQPSNDNQSPETALTGTPDGAVNDNDDQNANSNDDNANDDDNGNANSNDDNDNDDNSNTSAGSEQELFGTVEAITADSITINGVTYLIADFTEFKDLIAVGDTVKVHVIFNADGTVTIREIEISDSAGDDDNANSNDDNANSNDDNGNDDNGNDDNSNDNDNDNSSGGGNDNGNDNDDDNSSGGGNGNDDD